MKKKLLSRCLIGAALGLALSYTITIIVSLTVGDGRFSPVVPALIADCGSEIGAVVLQAVLSLVYGAALAGGTLIWEKDWSLTKQTVLHLIVCSVSIFPIAYFCRWMPHSLAGVLIYIGAFLIGYAILWLCLYAAAKKRVRQMNERMQERRQAPTR